MVIRVPKRRRNDTSLFCTHITKHLCLFLPSKCWEEECFIASKENLANGLLFIYGTPFFDDMFELNTYIMLLVVDTIMRHHV